MYECITTNISIFDLMAYIINAVGKSHIYKVNRALLSLTEDELEGKLNALISIRQEITSILDRGIQLPPVTAIKILNQVQKQLQTHDYAGIGILLELLDGAIGPFREVFPKLGYHHPFWKQVVEILPLNSNYCQMGIKLYPIVYPFWSVEKSSFFRIDSSTSFLKNYFILTLEDEQCAPVPIRYFYMVNQIFQRELQAQGQLSIALSPLCDTAHLRVQKSSLATADAGTRFMKTFCHALDNDCHIIAFPEAVGSRNIVSQMQKEMYQRPSKNTIVLPPTFYENGRNRALLLGPSGQIIHEQDKIIPFSVVSKKKVLQEQLISGESLNILLIEGLGGIVTPICRDFLEVSCTNMIYGTLPVHTIIVPSFTPGKAAFDAAAAKGRSARSTSMWINTCAAQNAGFDHTYDFNTVAFVEPPFRQFPDDHIECQRTCHGICSDNLCYFHIVLDYHDLKITCKHNIA